MTVAREATTSAHQRVALKRSGMARALAVRMHSMAAMPWLFTW
jgi:hypothetical protein